MSDGISIPLTVTTKEEPIILTDGAATKVKELMAREENAEDIALRVAVQPGGCSGMRYALFFDDRELEGDVVADQHGVPVRIDKMSAPHLKNTQIDWVDSLQGAGFSIENPNAQSSCACGDSFH
ncbi:iron-sulfur cluster assembly accessory protein [Egibacter rhizosphaerae]|uniref:Iron-sulfur cluster assembly accessory protein n=1 Tax=Egibacter rhizosphaerae TaxID=1670831 RepID=A0A411YAJ1_9ACTN|nr:iron-sulfur cluster assembly accessory protein [Egibacter rhizosphaerae]QBI18224.1 iron-sulfur cluster assembly accessory protein [Egibacter rhizosphaerae]